MIRIFKTEGNQLITAEKLGEKGSWVNITAPTQEELNYVSRELSLPLDLLQYPLDEEEISRIEVGSEEVLIIIKIPIIIDNTYDTIPLGIIIKNDIFVTISLEVNEIIDDFTGARPGILFTFKKTRFLLQILFRTASMYLKYLRQIDKKSNEIEKRLHQSMQNKELISLLDLQKSLVYFTTSLKSNGIVMEKILKSQLNKEPLGEDTRLIKMYAEDEDLLEDVIVENKQALEMGEIYTSILSGTMDAFASVISNNLNIVMKFLTSVTIVMAIPTIVASFYGMNVPLPFQNSLHAFAGTIVISILLSSLIILFFIKRKMF